ncbi:MAG: type IV secretory system conjugative DNA transfer family protein [Clostridia bacterium]|jgi:type IV secretion system protein VirD4|nr:type IV secretory system conjugative DNA transfer family protein [Clostridia bacterium]
MKKKFIKFLWFLYIVGGILLLYKGLDLAIAYLYEYITHSSLASNSSHTKIVGDFLGLFKITLGFAWIMYPLVHYFKHLEKKDKDKDKQEHGTAKIGDEDEMKGLTGDDGFVLSKNIRLSKGKSFEHVAILGPTGSGKSTSFFIPNLLELDGKTSIVVSDPKKEMYSLTHKHLIDQGYDIKLIEPFNPDLVYNPLLIAGKSITEMKEIAQMIMINGNKSYEIATGAKSGNAEWLNMAAPLLTASMIYSMHKGKQKDICEAMNLVLNTSDLNKLAEKFKEVPAAYQEFLIFAQAAGASKTISGIKITLSNALQIFTDPTIKEFTSTPFDKEENKEEGKIYYKAKVHKLFHPKMLRMKPTVLFVCVPERKATFLMPLMSVFYSQLLNKCMDEDGTPILFMLDEFANIGTIPNIANVIATSRSREIGISVGLQGMEQLKRNYGEDNAHDILNNLKTKVIFTGLTGTSAKYVSDLAGYTTMKTTSESKGKDSSNKTTSSQRRELLTPDEVRRMDEDKVLIIAHSKNAVMDDKNAYYTVDKYRKIMKKHNPDWK